MIRKTKSGYVLKSQSGEKKLGEFKTKKQAEKREQQIKYFKHKK
jgi:hypothetical protein